MTEILLNNFASNREAKRQRLQALQLFTMRAQVSGCLLLALLSPDLLLQHIKYEHRKQCPHWWVRFNLHQHSLHSAHFAVPPCKIVCKCLPTVKSASSMQTAGDHGNLLDPKAISFWCSRKALCDQFHSYKQQPAICTERLQHKGGKVFDKLSLVSSYVFLPPHLSHIHKGKCWHGKTTHL